MIAPTSANEISPDNETLQQFHRMRRIATWLFFVMVAIFIVTRSLEHKFAVLGYIRAFSEAAMVGALADWFAVTALFRRPFGLPIPHTAIIPRSKDRIGTGLGRFISRNFLRPEQLEQRLQKMDLAGGFAVWLSEDNRNQRIAVSLASAIPKIMGIFKDGPVAAWLERSIRIRLHSIDIAALFADGLELLTRENRHRPIVDLIITHADKAVNSNENEFRKRVTENTEWLPKLLSIDSKAADALLNAIRKMLHEAAIDDKHQFRKNIDDAILEFGHKLRHDILLRSELKQWFEDVTKHPSVNKYISDIWNDLRDDFGRADKERDEKIIESLATALSNISNAILNDIELRENLNLRLKNWAVELAGKQGEKVGEMVAETIRGWDAKTVVSQIENAVGRDLQFIRINGTIIGGFAGLLIHIIIKLF